MAEFLRSARIGRFCLEAAIELDDDPAVIEVEPPSLAEAFAGEQLKVQLQALADQVALSHPMMGPFLTKGIDAALRRYLDPLPWLPNPTREIALPKPISQDSRPAKLTLQVSSPTWAELGMSLVRLVKETGLPAQPLAIEIGEIPEDTMDTDTPQQLSKSSRKEVERGRARPRDVANGANTKTAETPDQGEKQTNGDGPMASHGPSKEKEAQTERNTSLPSRKRSQSTAGLPDAGDEENGDTKRSKRTRRRDTAAEEAVDPNRLFATQLQPYQAADENLFQMTKNVLENLGVSDNVTLERLSEILDSFASEERIPKSSYQAAVDLRDTLVSFNEGHARILLNKRDAPALGLNAFLEHTKSSSQHAPESRAADESRGLSVFVSRINNGWFTIHDVVYEWIMCVSKTYASCKWSDAMKTAVVQVISNLDETIYGQVLDELNRIGQPDGPSQPSRDIDELVQTLFELYLDIYERITNPNSVVEYPVRVETKGRLGRWMDVAAGLSRSPHREPGDELSSRFIMFQLHA